VTIVQQRRTNLKFYLSGKALCTSPCLYGEKVSWLTLYRVGGSAEILLRLDHKKHLSFLVLQRSPLYIRISHMFREKVWPRCNLCRLKIITEPHFKARAQSTGRNHRHLSRAPRCGMPEIFLFGSFSRIFAGAPGANLFGYQRG